MGITIFEKNKLDADFDDVAITVSDSVAIDNGAAFLNFLRNRKNDSGWASTGSTDAAMTTIEAMTGDAHHLTDLILIGHNLKSYTAQYWNGSSWQNFTPAVDVTANDRTTTSHHFEEVIGYGVRLVIRGTTVPDSDKLLSQLVLTKRIGQFIAQPMVKKPTINRGRKLRKMLSGRSSVTRTIGAFSCSLVFPPSKNQADQTLIEAMFESVNGFLVWLCGGDTSALPMVVPGFRLEDLILMTCANELDVEFKDGHYQHGQANEVALVESRT